MFFTYFLFYFFIEPNKHNGLLDLVKKGTIFCERKKIWKIYLSIIWNYSLKYEFPSNIFF